MLQAQEYQWNIHGVGEADDRSFRMAMSQLTNLYFTDYFMSAQLALGPHQISNSGNMDAFIASIGPDCLLPNPGFTYVADSFSVQFTAIPGAVTYSWDFGDGDTSLLAEPTHNYESSGTYNVCLEASNPCSKDSFCKEIYFELAIESSAILIYLVPSRDILKIDVPQEGQYDLTLYNTIGEPVYRTSFSRDTKGSFELDITSLATGIYICDVGSQNISLRKKYLYPTNKS